jgi:hypothetical protein
MMMLEQEKKFHKIAMTQSENQEIQKENNMRTEPPLYIQFQHQVFFVFVFVFHL